MTEYKNYPAIDDNYNFPEPIRRALANAPEIATVINNNIESTVEPRVASYIGSNSAIVDAAAAAVDANPQMNTIKSRLDFVEVTGVVGSNTPADTFEVNDEDGTTIFKINELSGKPYFDGHPTPISEYLDGDSFELRDGLNRVVFAVDDLSTNPHLRGSETTTNWDETHFILLVGQSNSMGIGTPSPVGTNNGLKNLFMVPQRGSGSGIEVKAVEPLAHPYNNPTANSIGHGWTVARKYALDNPNVKVVIIPLAMSGSGFFYSSSPTYTWAPSRVGESGMTNLYTEAVNRATSAINKYSGTKRVAMIIWHQGESDAVGETTQTNYETEMKSLIAGFRSQIPGASSTPVIVGQLGWEFRNVRKPGTWEQIDAAHKNLPKIIKGVSFAPAPPQGYMMADNTHFTALGQKLLADSIYSNLQAALYNT